ncbi:hypothetical protein Mapa_013562 [Marchantia paleacea]|nr:hypothetical protein Mapa_013562 [Marchantia paleacea]
MADWQEAVQASVIALIFAFMVAKLVSVVISFRGENLRVERGPAEKEGLISDASEGEELLGDEEASSSSDEEEEKSRQIEQRSELVGSVAERGLGRTEETDLPAAEELEKKSTPTIVDASLYNLSEAKSVELQEKGSAEEKDSASGSAQPEYAAKDNEAKAAEDIAQKQEQPEASGDAATNDEEGKKVKQSVEGLGELSDSDEWEGVESSELEELFGAAATFVATQAVGPGLKVSNDTQLLLYGLYKLATEGPCSTPQPSAYKMSARAKWNAWQKLGNIGPEEAMNRYIAVVSEMSPGWNKGLPQAEEQPQSSTDGEAVQRGGMGPVFSSLVMNEEGGEEEVMLEPIHVCAREGDVAGLNQQLESGTAVDLKDSDGRTALHWAADRGHLHAVELLLAKGAQIHSKDLEGQTALHYAATCEQEDIAKYLISKGADSTMPDKEGLTPLSSRPAQWTWMQATT